MPEELFLDTFVGDIPSPASSVSNEIPQEGLYNQYPSEASKETQINYNRPFIHSLSSGPLLTENYTLTEDVIIVYINIGVGVGGSFTAGINDIPAGIIIDGSVGGNFAIPNWVLRAGERLHSSILNASIHWVGYYLAK